MDEKTLNSLKTVFKATPSQELAKLICLAICELDELAPLNDYINEVDFNSLAVEESLQISQALYKLQNYPLALELLSPQHHAHFSDYIACLIKLEHIDKARAEYLEKIQQKPELENQHLNNQLGINKTPTERPKLKVVEKTDFTGVTDLARYQQKTTDFTDVVGLDNIKRQINKKIILPFQKPSLFQRFKKKIGGGVLLYGPPGCGKTLLARATAGECKADFYNIEISDVLDMWQGESEQKLHAIFEKARSNTPSVLFFDEFEALAAKREHTRNSSSNTVSQFLTELDGFTQNNTGVLVLASTNVPWAIDPAFLRPGRFDRMFFVPPPDKVARGAIIEHHMQERPSEDDIDYALLASKTPGYSGADLYNLVEMAADEAIDASLQANSEQAMRFEHFKEALQQSNPTTLEWLTTAKNYARYANDGGRYDEVVSYLKKYGK